MKKVLTLAFALALMVCLFAFGSLTASAATVDDFLFSVKNNEATITDYFGRDADLTIPASLKDSLGEYPVTAIGEEAFYNCRSLISVTIPNTVNTIGERAFYGCDSLTSANISENVTSIDSSSFSFCDSLTAINVHPNNPNYSSEGGVLFDKTKTFLVRFPDGLSGSYTIPNSVIVIAESAFKSCSLTSVIIPDSVTNIGDEAFQYCECLTSVTIGDGVTTISDNLFDSCGSLTSVTIPNSVTTIGYRAFCGCNSLASVTIPDRVTAIGDEAFRFCDSLTMVTLPQSVTSIGVDAFDCCNSLRDVYYSGSRVDKSKMHIHGSNTDLGFADWHFPIPEDNDYDYTLTDGGATIIEYLGDGGDVTIPSTLGGYPVTAIGDDAFYSCESLTSVTIPNSITTIGESAFEYCNYLTSVTIPDSVTTIGNKAFRMCESLIAVTIPDSVTIIGDFAYGYCYCLTSVTIGNGVTTIGNNAFYSCESLTAIDVAPNNPAYASMNGVLFNKDRTVLIQCPGGKTGVYPIPNSVTTIGKSAFSWCASLTSVTIGNGVTTIGEMAFYDCDSLTSVTIGDSVTTIGEWAFYGCDSLTSMTLPGSITAIGDYAFSDCNSLTDVYYSGTRADKRIMSIGSSNSDLIYATWHYADPIDNDYEYIINNGEATITFYFGDGGDVVIPATIVGCPVAIIDDGAFWWCDSLTSVTIPDSVTVIGEDAFWGCGSLANVYYFGSESDRLAVSIGDYNECLTDATWHYNCKFAAITTQPKDVSAAAGATAKVTVSATGDGLTYQWYIKNAGGSKFSKSSITKATYSVAMSDSANGRQVYCVITDRYGNSVTTNTVTLSMKTELKITKQPANVSVAKGDTAKVTVSVTGDGLTYQWYIKNAGGSKFSKSSITKATYSVAMSDSVVGRQIYCVITDQYGNSVKTNTVTLSMKTELKITKQPVSVCVKNGETATVKVTAVGEGLTYKWYFKEAGASSYKLTTSFTGNTYSITMTDARAGRRVLCIVYDKYGNSIQSKSVLLSQAVRITGQPTDVCVANGKTASVKVTAVGEGLTYRWYFKEAGASSYKYTSSFTGNTYSVTMTDARAGRRVLCQVYDKFGNMVQSKSALLAQSVRITKQPVSVTVAKGATAKVTLTAKGDGLTYKWYYKNPGATKFSLTTSFTGNIYSVKMDSSRSGRQVYCIITDKYGNSVVSNTVTLKMK